VLQWIWILPLLLIVYYAPPSPWWLVRKSRLGEAEEAIRRLTNPAIVSDDDVRATVALMMHTNQLEIEASAGTSYLDCFRRTDRRRTEIVMMVFAMQLLSGQNLVGYGVQFLQNSGLSTSTAYSLSMVLNSMFIIGTIVSWGCM
jgi:SP family general alpha glucoside:H+ symporter-like MFS transporter